MFDLPLYELEPRPRWFWLEGAVAGALIFPLTWLIEGQLWLSAFPHVVQMHAPMFAAFIGCVSPTSLIAAPLPSLTIIGVCLGSASGWAWQLWPRFAARVLAVITGLAGCYWSVSQLDSSFPLWPTLFTPSKITIWATAWFDVLPYLLPFAWSLALIALAFFMRKSSPEGTLSPHK